MNKLIPALLTTLLVALPVVVFTQDEILEPQDVTPPEETTVVEGASEEASEEIQATLTPLSEEDVARYEALRGGIHADEQVLRAMLRQIEATEGLIQSVAQARYDKIAYDRFAKIIELARLVVLHTVEGKLVGDHETLVREEIPGLPDAIFGALDRIGKRFVLPDDDMEIVDLVTADQGLFKLIGTNDEYYQLLLDFLRVSAELGLDVEESRSRIVDRIGGSAAGRSVFLDLSATTVSNLHAAVGILPGNTDITDRLSAAEARVRLTAQSLQRISVMMSELDLDTSQYRQQVLTATGEITADVLDVGVVAQLITQWSGALIDFVTEEGPGFLFRVLLVVAIVYVFHRASHLVQKLINRALDASNVKISSLLRRMVISSAKNLVIILGVLIALSQIGISLGPLLAGLGIAGFIIGFAMQDSLSNFASGMLILLYRPFDVGDVVEAGGVSGKVNSMSLVNTTIMTFDNQTLVVPNNLIWRSVIRNLTHQKERRVDLLFGIAYSDDIEKAERVFREVVTEHEKVLDEPEPMIHLHELADSSVNFIVRPWVKTEDYWDVYWDLMKAIKIRLDQEGITIPFPQRDVHMHGSEQSSSE